MNYDDRELLARMIMCESGGEGENGMRAVASVIMNRVYASTGEYQRVGQGNLRDIIFQKYQFDCAMTSIHGQYNAQNLYNMRPTQIHYDIADWALGGGRLNGVGTSLWFHNPYGECRAQFPNQSGKFYTRINNHCFYAPTPHYKTT